MSRLSIYETRWINLVFENRNKEYGAYQLRKESVRTSLFAFFAALLFLASAISIPAIINHFIPENTVKITIPDIRNTIIHLSDIIPIEIEKNVLPAIKNQKPEVPLLKDKFVNPVIVHQDLASPDVAKNENTNSATVSTNGTNSGAMTSAPSGTGPEINLGIDKGNELVTVVALDKLPEFPGGINKFYNYVGNNFEKPEIDGTSTIKVYVSFVIEKDGSMTDIQVKKDPGYGLAKEAIRVLKSLKTKWSPGMIGSKPVRTSYNLPITVQMD